MSTACKCDFCGKFMDKEDRQTFIIPTINGSISNNYTDVCADCKRALFQFARALNPREEEREDD